jgi:magnesium and cobalt transporter
MSALLMRAPDDREQLLEMLRAAQQRELLDAEAMAMIEGVLEVAELRAGDIMVPRSRMDVIELSQSPSEFVPFVIRTAHSRFPVVERDRDRVVGIVHAKDLLRLQAEPQTVLGDLLRPAVFIPETKRLNVLLRDFRENRSHLAIVVDEYGGVCGLITIEDVLEQIVGEIADEFDLDDAAQRIVETAPGPAGRRWRVLAQTPLERFNGHFGLDLASAAADTVGGLLAERLGRVPRRGDRIELDGWRIEVLRADPRSAQVLRVEAVPESEAAAGAAH